MRKVIIHRHAAKYLKRLSKDTKQRIKTVLMQIEKAPVDHPSVKYMVGEWNGYHRIRVGNASPSASGFALRATPGQDARTGRDADCFPGVSTYGKWACTFLAAALSPGNL